MKLNTDELVRIVYEDGTFEESSLSEYFNILLNKEVKDKEIKRVDRTIGICQSKKMNFFERDSIYLKSLDFEDVYEVYDLFQTEHNIPMSSISYVREDGTYLTFKEVYQAQDIESDDSNLGTDENRQVYNNVRLLEVPYLEYLGINAVKVVQK